MSNSPIKDRMNKSASVKNAFAQNVVTYGDHVRLQRALEIAVEHGAISKHDDNWKWTLHLLEEVRCGATLLDVWAKLPMAIIAYL